MVSGHLKLVPEPDPGILLGNVLSDGGDEFFGGEDLEVLFGAPAGQVGAMEGRVGVVNTRIILTQDFQDRRGRETPRCRFSGGAKPSAEPVAS